MGTLTGSPTTLNSDIVKRSKNLSASSFSGYSDGNWIRLCEPNNPHVHESWAIYDKVVGQITQLETVDSTTAAMKDEASKLYSTSYGTWIQRVFPIQNVGIENLKIKRLDIGEAPDGSNIYIKYAVNCWIKGVESDNTCRHHIMIDWSSHVEVSGCYFYKAESYGDGGYGYGVLLERSSTNCLIENNIFRKLRHAMIVQAGANCNVFEFNYSRDHYWTKWGIEWSSEPWDPPFVDVWPGGDISIHGNYPYANLFEYNYIERIIADGYHGANGPYHAFIRNLPYDDHSSFGRGWIILHDSPNSSVLGNKGGDNNNPPINTSGNTSLSVDLYGFEGGYEGAGRIHNYYWSYGGWDDAYLLDISYYYSSRPNFMTESYTWPTIGPRADVITSQSIPARERYINSSNKTYNTDPIIKPSTSKGTLTYDETWIGSHTITGIIMVPSGVTLTISNSTNITLNGYSIISTGGTITVESGATINPSNSHTRLITGSAIQGIYSTIASAMSAATGGQSIEVYGSHTLAANLTVPPGVTLTFKNGSDITLDSHTIQKGSGSLAIESGATFTPDIRLMSGSTVLGLYTTIDDAFNHGSELHLRGEFIFNDTYTLTSGRKLVVQDGALLKYPSGKTLEIAGGGTLEGNNATFTSISGTWGGIYYQENSSGSLSGCTITHATTAIRDHSGKTGQDALVLSSNIISDASYGISSLNSSTYIFYNNLTDITTRAINTSGVNASPEITFNEISNSENFSCIIK